ncbi:MAG: hypothetical protein KatS3mg031_3076 [Chitinophagales bacterium]|nr:MAG: hypothetical protein KatS3mg031_3076 [Chitinophagales bacterium]
MVKNLIADTNVFLEEAWNKGEILRFVTDPVKYKKEFGYAKTFGQEIEWLESKLGKKIEEVIDPKSGTIDLSKYNKLQGK